MPVAIEGPQEENVPHKNEQKSPVVNLSSQEAAAWVTGMPIPTNHLPSFHHLQALREPEAAW